MATIRKVTPSGGISEFRGAAPEAGGGFRLLAAGFDALYDRVLPKAIAEETEKGAALGREMAKQQIGGNGQVYASSAGGNGRYRDAIASIESAGSGDYSAVGPTHATMGRALGRYQIMEANIGPWSQEALGRKVTADEFLKNPAIQDAIFDHKFGGYVAQYGEAGAAQAWFAGPGGVGKTDRTDVLGTSVGEYGDKFMRALGGTVTASSSGADPAFTPTMLKDADGNLVQRLYDPSSDPIKQAFNMAAGADYQAQVFLKSSVDLMAMREQFALDPAGFKGAADAYLDGIVEKAPDLFKGDIRAGLAKEAQQVFLGIIDDQHRDIQKRAANSNGALIDKWSDSLGAAIAGGDPKEIAAARSNLDAALSVRERLPGLAWTPEQSAEVHRKAAEDGQRRIPDGQNKMISGWKSTLKTIVDAAKAGRRAAGEELLDNPNVMAALPDEVREALAFTTLRDTMPSIFKLPPKETSAWVAEQTKAAIVNSPWEVDYWGYAEKAVAANAEAWAKDPIKRAGEVLENKPAPMPDLANIEALPAWLESRAAYGQSLADQGFTPKPVFVSAEEATALGALFGKDVPADLKLGALTAVVGAMGENASGFFDQINMSDKTVRAAGMALAAGVDPRVAEDALVGRQRLDEGIIQSPEDKAVMGAFDDGMRTAVMSVPGASAMMGEMKDLAISIYAATVPQNATSGQQKDAMAEAWKRALGQTETPTGTRGGVQDVGGNPAWLAPSMSGEEINGALRATVGADGGPYAPPINGDVTLWEKASGGKQPAVGGRPLTFSMLDAGQLAISPDESGRNLYRLQVVHSDGTRSDVRVMGSDAPFIFDAEKLVEAYRVWGIAGGANARKPTANSGNQAMQSSLATDGLPALPGAVANPAGGGTSQMTMDPRADVTAFPQGQIEANRATTGSATQDMLPQLPGVASGPTAASAPSRPGNPSAGGTALPNVGPARDAAFSSIMQRAVTDLGVKNPALRVAFASLDLTDPSNPRNAKEIISIIRAYEQMPKSKARDEAVATLKEYLPKGLPPGAMQ
jgi:hypothetical protein